MTRSYRFLIIYVLNPLAAVLMWVAECFEEGSRRLKRCPDCGESIYYGKPCPELR